MMNVLSKVVQKPLGLVAKVAWGNTSITKASYVENGFPAFSATGSDGFLPTSEWEGPAVILSAIGARCGKCFYADGKWTAIKNTIVIQGDTSTVLHKFLFYYLNDATRWKISGSGQPFITLKTARAIEVPLSSIREQNEIVAEIEKQFTRLEAGVAALKRVQANLKRYRAAVLKSACEGKLVPTNTNNWRTTIIGELSSIVTKGSSPNWQGFEYCENGIIFVRSQNVAWGKLDLSDVAHLPVAFNNKEKKSVLKSGDVLLNIVGASIGRAAIATAEIAGGNVNQAVAVIRPLKDRLLPQFLVCYLLSERAQTFIHAQKVDVARANFSLEQTRNLPIALPDLAEQTRIVAEVERRLSVIDELEGVVKLNLDRAVRLRQAILQKAFSGNLA